MSQKVKNPYVQLHTTETNFNNLLHTLQESRRRDSYIPSNNLKDMVVDVFDGMKQGLIEMLEAGSWGCSEDGSNSSSRNSHNARLREILLQDLTTLRFSQESPLANPAEAMGRRPGLKGLLDFKRTSRGFSYGSEDVDSDSLDTVMITDDDVDAEVVVCLTPSTSPSVVSDGPIPDVDTSGPQPTRAEVSFRGEVLSMLSRMTQRLTGFFQWLKTKVRRLASKAWQKVNDTFTAMFNFLKNACQRLRGTGGQRQAATYTKLHSN